jgi:hypothetical protein
VTNVTGLAPGPETEDDSSASGSKKPEVAALDASSGETLGGEASWIA